MSTDFELPSELVCRPLALVGLSGLEIEKNAVHQTIWDSFVSSNRAERPPLNLIHLQPNHVFPPAKPQRASYEWYIPKGILKRSWMSKHLYKIPALVVMFYDLEWDDPSWKQKHSECSERLQELRTALNGRNTKIVLVLVQNNPPLPTGEDLLAAERAAALCQACDLAPKSLFVLPSRSDHLQGYILRLESAFYELCQSSYHHSARSVRAHRDQLNRTNHGYLFIRHQFKMGFYNELKQDVATANKHYTQAYSYIQDLRITDANVTEVKIVAGYIGYKIWKLTFMINFPRDAITHFRSHIDFFRMRIGNPALKFEHHAWLSKQYAVFGGLFQEAIDLGLPPIQTQHPGFFYQQAAQQANLRKKCVHNELENFVDDDGDSIPSLNFNSLEFYGQRPWRPGRLSLEPSDMKLEMKGIHALLLQEKSRVPHTQIIVGLLSNAVNQFKNYRSPRMKQLLLVQMAEEYAENGNHGEALALLESLLWEYRKDYWWKPLTSLLQLGLHCAYLSGRVAEYISFAVELCSNKTTNSFEEKQRTFSNLLRIVNGKVPEWESDSESDVQESAGKAARLWTDRLRESTDEYALATVLTSTVCTFVDLRATFSHSRLAANEPVTLQLHVRYNGPEEIQFSEMFVELSNLAYSEYCRQENAADLKFQPSETKTYTFVFPADTADVGKDIQIKGVHVKLGSAKHFAVIRCDGSTSDDFAPVAIRNEFLSHQKSTTSIELVNIFQTVEIAPKTANLDLQLRYEGPILQNEVFPVEVYLVNVEKNPLKEVEMKVSTDKGFIRTDPDFADNPTNEAVVQLPAIAAGESLTKILYLRCQDQGTCTLSVLVNSQVDDEVCGKMLNFSCFYRKEVTVDCVVPLQCRVEYQSCEFQQLNQIPLGEDHVIFVQLTNVSPFALTLHSGAFQLDFGSQDGVSHSQLNGITLEPGESGSDIVVVSTSTNQTAASQTQTGNFCLKWNRSSGRNQLPAADFLFQLPPIDVEASPLHVSVNLPAYGHVRKPLNASLRFRNDSGEVLELDIVVDSNDAFMFAGNKQSKARILPGESYDLNYNLYPLLSGFVALPPFRITSKDKEDFQMTVDEILKRSLPTHIFVLPQVKEKRSVSAVSA